MFTTGTSNRRTVQHFTHNHPLTEVNGTGEFTCGGCKTYGSDKSFRCVTCNYDYHDFCATCPPTLRTFMHPLYDHELRLLSRGPGLMTRPSQCRCDVCEESIEGLYYRCDHCDFDVHPLCTRLPQHVRHVLHPAHPLELGRWGASTCAVCRGTCRSWWYRCGTCGFDVHMECLAAVARRDSSATVARGFGPRPYPYPYHYPNPSYNHYQLGYGYNGGHVNPGQTGSGSGKIFGILSALGIGIICNIIAAPATDFLTGCF